MKRCFVISPIGGEGSATRRHADKVYRWIIEPAMKECEIKPFRSDHLVEPGKISEQMFSSILTSDLCVAVLTEYNPNVFYELAIAQTAARPVIILIEKGHDLPFDIQDLRCVYYDLEIDSYEEKIYINQVIHHVRNLEAKAWKVPRLLTQFDIPRRQSLRELQDQISGGQARLLGHVVQQCKNGSEVTQRDIESAMGYSSSELFYRLETLVLQGFLLKERISTEGQFSYSLSDHYKEVLGI